MKMVSSTSLDRKVLGNSRPSVTGGWTSTLSYKNLSLFARFDYALGHTIYNDLKLALWDNIKASSIL